MIITDKAVKLTPSLKLKIVPMSVIDPTYYQAIQVFRNTNPKSPENSFLMEK